MRRRLTIAVALAAAAVLPAACGGAAAGEPGEDRDRVARNVIFIMGDGMGVGAREFLRLALAGPDGELAMDGLPVAGRVHTSAADPEWAVTDSAAAATALATGVKTYNGAIGVGPDGQPVRTVLERAKAAGKSTGLVTTSQVTDATPAAFAAHVAARSDQSAIAEQYLEPTGVDVILGGGEDHWFPEGDPGAHPDRPPADPEEASAGTRGDLVERAVGLGYEYVSDAKELQAAGSGKLLGLFANEEMFEHRGDGEGGSYAPAVPLSDMTAKALEALADDEDGFFLVVEEEGIDEMAHHNNAQLLLEAGRALDAAVEVALRFQAEHPDTLIILTGDHETGGLAIEDVNPQDESGDAESREDGPFTIAGTATQFVVDWSTWGHTGADIPVTAGGPGAGALDGVVDNTDVHTAMLDAMQLED
ncbi:alkaline phosphatase [Pseudonocardia nigra]|uniref:alkaline phosphatase n=1 Tax=Pseudonocardia nigra TaxID=1921578 RepID=UPI001C5E1362|nr:alkaline phosphatase [Pseudonocardia nigra]